MEAVELKRLLVDGIKENARLGRDYLGMSQIAKCSRQLYFDLKQGERYDDQTYWYTWLGYMFQYELLRALPGGVEYVSREIVAFYDPRVKGHVDFELDGDLVEIKTVNWAKFQKAIQEGVHRDDYQQVQMYLRHGGWPRALVVYICRDVPHREWYSIPVWVLEVLPEASMADTLDAKAKTILAAVDAGGPAPECDCGWCRD
ncbi:MAG: hypothetical protein KJ077_11290 [Anaerolineae bacterium]|nr:hypothetical protein [Anaerolineae bacterium]